MAQNWSDMGERGSAWGLSFVVGAYRILGRTVCRALLVPIVGFFFLTGGAQRRASADYLQIAWKQGAFKKRPGLWEGYRHFLSFGYALIDKFAAWNGDIRSTDVDGVDDGLFDHAKKTGRGALVISAHMGNPEVIRAVATVSRRFRVNVLMHTRHAERFNRVLSRVAPDSPVRMMQVSEIDVGAAMQLAAAIERGEWVVMTGDRVALGDADEKSIPVGFLGKEARFPIGPIILAAALKCPAYTMFTVRRGKRYGVSFEKLADPVRLPRGERTQAIRDYVETYVARLEREVKSAPYQWFNFYDYWNEQDERANERTSASKAVANQEREA